jgi:hypothetical protein
MADVREERWKTVLRLNDSGINVYFSEEGSTNAGPPPRTKLGDCWDCFVSSWLLICAAFADAAAACGAVPLSALGWGVACDTRLGLESSSDGLFSTTQTVNSKFYLGSLGDDGRADVSAAGFLDF